MDWTHIPSWLWKHNPRLFVLFSRVLATLPLVVALALLFYKLFGPRAVLCAFVCMLTATLLTSAGVLRHYELIVPAIRLMWAFYLSFLVGPPILCYLIAAMRSNQRLERP
jgi:hypothetical protein